MSDERLSKLQKYILSACYKKTILKEPLPKRMYRFEHNEYKDVYFQALFESDILLNYYNMNNYNNELYGYVGGSNKEKTALRRSIKTLYERGYINEYNQFSIYAGDRVSSIGTYSYSYQSMVIITLTLKGEETAKQLLNVVGTTTSTYLQH